MQVFITGARGFVMSVTLQRLLADPDVRVVAADLAAPDDVLRDALADVAGRVDFLTLDVRDANAVDAAVRDAAPDVIVHGATVTQVPAWEREKPAWYVDVNVMGTTHVLDAARRCPSVQRVVLASSAAVYGAGTGDPGPLAEDAPLLPDEMYGITKVAGEAIARRFAALYDLDIPIVRFTKVFGPMERPSSARAAMSLPYHLAAALSTGTPCRVTPRTLDAAGDWISAVDVAEAITALCRSAQPHTRAYHLASGISTSVRELLALFGTEATTADPEDADVDMDPALRYGKNAVYSVRRAEAELGWRPRPLADQVAEYVRWARARPEIFTAPHHD